MLKADLVARLHPCPLIGQLSVLDHAQAVALDRSVANPRDVGAQLRNDPGGELVVVLAVVVLAVVVLAVVVLAVVVLAVVVLAVLVVALVVMLIAARVSIAVAVSIAATQLWSC